MRISRIPLAGLALVLVGAAARTAHAGDVTVSTATTTPLVTSSPDGVSPGNVTVSAGGSIAVAAGQSAVTIDSNNNVNIAGSLTSNDADNTRGVTLTGGFSGTLVNSGTISLLESHTLTDADSDGDFDGEFAVGTNRIGIFLAAGPTFTGNVAHNTGAINIEGVNSAGIRLDALLTGNLSSLGGVGVVGDNSQAIALNGGVGSGVTGDVTVRGIINVRGENSVGVLANAPIGGELRLGGDISVSGFHSLTRPTNPAVIAALDADDLLVGGSAVAVHYSVADGVIVAGVGVEDDLDDDGDAILETDADPNTVDDADDDLTANLQTFGSAPVILITPNASDPVTLNLGAGASGFGFHNRGQIAANGVYDGFSATGVRIAGAGGAGVNVAGGVLNDGTVTAISSEADAIGYHIGNGAVVPEFVNRRAIATQSLSDTDHSAYAVFIGAGASTPIVRNTGTIGVQLLGELGDAIGIIDQSNTLALVENSGTIQAQVFATDSDQTDSIIPVALGSSIALDVSSSTINVTYRQLPDTPFTDDDSVDNDVNARPPVRTIGQLRFGSGNDTVELLSGQILGDISFGAGADNFVLGDGTFYSGRVSDSNGALTIDVGDAFLGLAGGTLNITSAHFGPSSELAVLLSPDVAETTRILASGSITFDPGAVVTPVIPDGLPESGTQIFLTAAGGLVGGANVERTLTGAGAPWVYNLSVGVASGDANSLEASYVLKSASELGFNVNQAAAFNPILDALRTDTVAANAFAALTTELAFIDSYQDLLPNYSSAAAELAATAIQQSQGATTNRMAATRLNDLDHVSVWAQEIGYGVTREAESYGVEYRGAGFGLAVGIDGPLENGALFGLSASFVASEVEEPARKDGEIAASIGQLNAYLGTSMGPLDLDLVGGLGVGKMKSRRFVNLGANYQAIADAEWWAYEGHATARASAPMSMGGALTLTPYAQLTYVGMSEQDYQEEGGGSAIDLDVDQTFSQRLWADAGVQLGARWRTSSGSAYSPHISVGYRANAIDEAADRTVRFVSGGSAFTLVDETEGTGGPLFGLGFDATNGYSTFSIDYEGEYGDQLTRHSLNAALRFRF